MTAHALALAALVAHCAPTVAPSTMMAIIQVESSANALAIGDNTAGRSYYPRDRAAAETLARGLLAAGHSLDLGIAQVDSMNLAGFGVNVHTIFDPCTNLNVGSRILAGDYAFARRRYGRGQVALRHAIGMYNTGRLDAGTSYVRRVLAAAGIREAYDPAARAPDTRKSMRGALLVPVSAARLRATSRRHRTIAPSRAPILVRVLRASSVTIF
jgi:type IV secretion system protein VirB1